MKELIFVAGARPNFMKIAPIIRAFQNRPNPFAIRLVHTGQHYDEAMSDIFFRQLRIPAPDVSLGVGSGIHGEQTGKILIEFERVLARGNGNVAGVVVVGDVNSTIACALAATKVGVPVAHVEAGLRSFDRTMPEEINRILTDAVSDVLLVTEQSGIDNLRREGIDGSRVTLVGNVMIDTLLEELPRSRENTIIRDLSLTYGEYALVTMHRPSNVDSRDRLEMLIDFLERVSRTIALVLPLHPRTRARIVESGLTERVDAMKNVKVIGPAGYHENLCLMTNAKFVITDSGGMQEETTVLGVPCLTMRTTTERPVTVERGTSCVLGTDYSKAERVVDSILHGKYKTAAPIPLWDGHAAERIADVLIASWGRQS